MLSAVVPTNPATRHAAVFFSGVRPPLTMNRATAAARHLSDGKAPHRRAERFEVDRHPQRIALELKSWLSSHPSSLNKCRARSSDGFHTFLRSTRASACASALPCLPRPPEPGGRDAGSRPGACFHQCTCTRVMLARSGSNPAGTQRLAFCMV